MKKIFSIALIAVVLVSSFSCGDFLDVNQNVNKATTSTPELVLPQAIVFTASNLVRFNQYGGSQVGYLVNAGGYGGWGSYVTYTFTTSDYNGLWADTYSLLTDVQYVIDNSVGKKEYTYHEAAARIMKSYNFQMLVDTYNDIPYTDAFKGAGNLTPKYDKAADIYKALADDIDAALTLLNAGVAIPKSFPPSDPMFGGSVTKWKQFANTIKLRLILRAGNKVAFSNKTFDPAGFLDDDAIVQPGYTKQNGKQNPAWNYYTYAYDGTTAGSLGLQYLPSDYVYTFYNGTRVYDEVRGPAVYSKFLSTPTNQLGYTKSDAPSATSPNVWFIGTDSDSKSVGIFKGFAAGAPIMLAAESYFLQAEASLTGLIAGDVTTAFNNGIKASIAYTYKDVNGATDEDVDADFTLYQDDNYDPANTDYFLVDITAATSDEQRLQAIITQKYIANNMINGMESWSEYRRTHYPAIVNGSTNSLETFASLTSSSPRADKLPARILYPNTEYQYNPGNIPANTDAFNSTIFWAK